ncbi:hypothetical protein COOONC_16561 [Cooperia oncophora]
MNTLFVRPRVSLPKMADDERLVIVFALDYLLGTRAGDGSKHTRGRNIGYLCSQGKLRSKLDWILKGGALKVSLIGGPRPNPEECLCFRNLLHLYRRDDSIFTESAPKITIQFNFALDDTRQYGSLSRSTTQLGDSLHETPAPTRKEIADVVPADRVDGETERSSQRKESRKEARREDSDTALTDQEEVLPPIIKKKPTPITTPILHQKIDRVIEQESPRQNLPISYALPLKEARVSNVPRSVYAALSNVQFPGIFDREGDPPVMVDVTSTTLPSRAVEINDGLNTNEIIVQFMAFKRLNKHEVPPIRKLFFTHVAVLPDSSKSPPKSFYSRNRNNTNGEPSILMRLNQNGEEQKENGAGFAVSNTFNTFKKQGMLFSGISAQLCRKMRARYDPPYEGFLIFC